MLTCYVDEAGNGESLLSTSPSNTTPVFVVAGLILNNKKLGELTKEFLSLKRKFYGQMNPHRQDDHWVLREVKGATLRGAFRKGNRQARRTAEGFINHTFDLLEVYQAKVIGRVWVKELDKPCHEKPIYTFSIQDIFEHFDNYLESTSHEGLVVCDSRGSENNSDISHSIFTRKNRIAGDPYRNIVEMPLFGHSINHIGIQLTDVIVSAIIFPIASLTYSASTVPSNDHVQQSYQTIRDLYGSRLKEIQYRYQDLLTGKFRGGIVVSDPIGKKSAAHLFG